SVSFSSSFSVFSSLFSVEVSSCDSFSSSSVFSSLFSVDVFSCESSSLSSVSFCEFSFSDSSISVVVSSLDSSSPVFSSSCESSLIFLPQFGQKTLLSSNCIPQFEQTFFFIISAPQFPQKLL